MIPENYWRRTIDFAKQGYTTIEFPTFNTDWDSRRYTFKQGPNSRAVALTEESHPHRIAETHAHRCTLRVQRRQASSLCLTRMEGGLEDFPLSRFQRLFDAPYSRFLTGRDDECNSRTRPGNR